MSEDLSNVDRAQLTAWAYGRTASADEADRAHRAAVELARRADHAVTSASSQHPGSTHSAPRHTSPRHATAERVDAERTGTEPIEDEDEPEAGISIRGRVAIGAGVAALLIGAVIASQALLAPHPLTATSLEIFDRAETADERALIGQFERAGERVSLGPRELGDVGFGTIVAYRSIVNSSGVQEPTLDLVCVAAAEFTQRTQNTTISNPTCVARAVFEQRGLTTTLYGIGGQYDVKWGPQGAAQLDVLISESQRLVMEPGYLAIFVDRPASELDELYIAEQLLFASAGVNVTQFRTLNPVAAFLVDNPDSRDEVPPDAEWLAAYTGEELDGSNPRACLAIVAAGEQLENNCLPIEEMASGTITLQFERGDLRMLTTWDPRGDISTLATNRE